jgi:hypothetical protein
VAVGRFGGEAHDRSPYLSDWWLVFEPGTDRTRSWTRVVKVVTAVKGRFMSALVSGVTRRRRLLTVRTKRPAMTIHPSCRWMFPAIGKAKTIVEEQDATTVYTRQELAHDDHLP